MDLPPIELNNGGASRYTGRGEHRSASGSVTDAEAPSTAPRSALARWLLVGGLLMVEFVSVGVLFDTHALLRHTDPVWRAFGAIGKLSVLPVVVAAALFILSGDRLRVELRALAASASAQTSPIAGWLVVHFAVFAAFGGLTRHIFVGLPPDAPYAIAWIGSWAIVAAAVAGTLLQVALPMSQLLPLLRRMAGALLVGALVGAGAWGAGLATNSLWTPLSRLTLQPAAALLALVADDWVVEPDTLVLGTERFWVVVAPECSGYEGAGLMLVFLCAFMWSFRDRLRFPNVLVLLPVAVFAVWIANIIRITSLILIGTWGAPELALGGFHSKAGWIFFSAIALGSITVAQSHRFFSVARSTPAGRRDATAAYLVPLIALIGGTLVFGAFTVGDFDSLYPLRVIVALAVLWGFRRTYAALEWGWSWTAVGIGAFTFVLWVAFEPAPDAAAVTAWADQLAALPTAERLAWIGFRVIGAAITVPIVEELAFRGYLLRKLVSPDFEQVPFDRFSLVALIVSSLAFGLLHGRWISATVAGMLYAVAQYRGRRLSDAALAHAITNAMIAGYVLSFGKWSLWI